MKKPPKALEELLRRDAHFAPSKLPSDNLSPLKLDALEWEWIDAIWLADQKRRDPARLIALLGQGRPVPPAVMPYVGALLQARLGHKGGRPGILSTWKTIYYYAAERQVRELVAEGMRVGEACKQVAPQWNLKKDVDRILPWPIQLRPCSAPIAPFIPPLFRRYVFAVPLRA